MSEPISYSDGTPSVPFYDGHDYKYHNAAAPAHDHDDTAPLAGTRPLHLAEKSVPGVEAPYRSYNPESTSHSTSRSEKLISRGRLVIRFFTLAASVAIVGLLAHSITVYHSTSSITEPVDNSNNRVSVWPSKLVLRPTLVLLGVASFVSLISIILILLSISSHVRHMTKLGNTLNLVGSTLELVLWIGSTVYYKSWDGGAETYDLLDWTCKRMEFKFESINFSSVCVGMRFVWIMGIVLAAFELLNVVALFYWHFIGKKHARAHRYERT